MFNPVTTIPFSMTSLDIANLIDKPHAWVRYRIANRLKRHPELLAPLFTKQAFVNDQGQAELAYDITTEGIKYLVVELGKDGTRLNNIITGLWLQKAISENCTLVNPFNVAELDQQAAA